MARGKPKSAAKGKGMGKKTSADVVPAAALAVRNNAPDSNGILANGVLELQELIPEALVEEVLAAAKHASENNLGSQISNASTLSAPLQSVV